MNSIFEERSKRRKRCITPKCLEISILATNKLDFNQAIRLILEQIFSRKAKNYKYSPTWKRFWNSDRGRKIGEEGAKGVGDYFFRVGYYSHFNCKKN